MTGLDKLFDIISMEGDGFRNGPNTRKFYLEKWIREHIVEFEVNQSVVSKKYLSSEHEDSIITRLSELVAEEMMNEGLIKVERKDKDFKAKVKGLK